ncbi:MAG: pyridoxamine kinase [Candidatus Methanomethylophilaceae archaeon]|nr:pyridoxamine kinase [Candidatus Methanomethylophilaceae archaeon]
MRFAMQRQQRVVAIHDISCFGRCSLTVALPIISSAGIECSVIPTAVLSTHTGGFTGFTYRDLTEDITPIVDHWKTLDLRFDGIYTGFLGSFEQIDIVSDTFDRLRDEGTLIVVDPVMADNGRLYSIFPENFPTGMRKICSKADVIIPNITEACLLLGEKYVEGPYTKEYIEGLLRKLSAMGPKKVILTGVFFDTEKLGAAAYDAETDRTDYAFRDCIPGYYHGTGDVFGSATVTALISGKSLAEANRIAVNFTVDSILRTRDAKTDIRFGVDFESGIPKLLRALGIRR